MNIYYESSVTDPGLEHHGIKGMKWGIRRFQNPDGSLTEAGKRRYGTVEGLRAAYDDKLRRKTTRLRRKAEATTDTAKASKYNTDADSMEKDYKNWMEDRAKSQETKKKIAEEKEKAKTDREAETKEKDKKEIEKAVATGDPSKISDVMEKMSTQEIKDAINRIDTMKSLRDKIEPGILKRAFGVVADATKDRMKQAVTEAIMNVGKDPEDGLSKDEKEKRQQLKDVIDQMKDLGSGVSTNKDYSSAFIKGQQESVAKDADKVRKTLIKNGIDEKTAANMSYDWMNKRMSEIEGASERSRKTGDSESGGGNQNVGKPKNEGSGSQKQAQDSKEQGKPNNGNRGVVITVNPNDSSKFTIASEPKTKGVSDFERYYKNTISDFERYYKEPVTRVPSSNVKSKVAESSLKTPVSDTRVFTNNSDWKEYYAKQASDKAWNDRYKPDTITFNFGKYDDEYERKKRK